VDETEPIPLTIQETDEIIISTADVTAMYPKKT
jgi:hypothetical protein